MFEAFIQGIGTIVLVLYVAGCLGFIDFHLCVGPVDHCNSKNSDGSSRQGD